MKRIAVIVLALLAVGVGAVYAVPSLGVQSRLKTLLSKVPFIHQNFTQTSSATLDGIVLGEEESAIEGEIVDEDQVAPKKKTTFTIPPEVNGVVQSATETVGNFINTSMKPFLQPDQKIEVDKAIQQAQENLDQLPSDIVEKARYDYCQQVVQDYEDRR